MNDMGSILATERGKAQGEGLGWSPGFIEAQIAKTASSILGPWADEEKGLQNANCKMQIDHSHFAICILQFAFCNDGCFRPPHGSGDKGLSLSESQ
jgi:hypothetical protein